MSLHSYLERATPRRGVYNLMWYGGNLVLLSLSEEDTNHGGGKAEGDLKRDHEMRILTSTMFSVISGGVKTYEGETDIKAAQRETEQEGGLLLQLSEFQSLGWPETRTIQERKGRGPHDITGVGFQTSIDGVGLSIVEATVKERGGELKVLSVEEASHLSEEETRPFLRTVLELLARERTSV